MGRIVAEYNKDPKKVMERVKGEKA
jgi:hypothetical protein